MFWAFWSMGDRTTPAMGFIWAQCAPQTTHGPLLRVCGAFYRKKRNIGRFYGFLVIFLCCSGLCRFTGTITCGFMQLNFPHPGRMHTAHIWGAGAALVLLMLLLLLVVTDAGTGRWGAGCRMPSKVKKQ